MTGRWPKAARLLLAAAGLAIWLCGCQPFQKSPEAGVRLLPHSDQPSALAVILGSGCSEGCASFRGLIAATARTGEHLLVIGEAGASWGPFVPRTVAGMTGPALPASLRPGATSFQRDSYQKALKRAQKTLDYDRALVQARQQRELRAWADRITTAGLPAKSRSARPDGSGLVSAVTDAVTAIASWQQTGIDLGARKAIVIIGSGPGLAPQSLRASLDGMTVVVADAPGAGAAAGWQYDLLQAGASRAFAFTAATVGRLAAVVAAGLAGQPGVAFHLTQVRYRPAQYSLPSTAIRPLHHVLHLLMVSYPQATATIYAYTDSIAVPGGNLLLSWRRAQAVQTWLTQHGIAASRLQAMGLGAADPVAPNRPGGQPLNRRVVIIIYPSG